MTKPPGNSPTPFLNDDKNELIEIREPIVLYQIPTSGNPPWNFHGHDGAIIQIDVVVGVNETETFPITNSYSLITKKRAIISYILHVTEPLEPQTGNDGCIVAVIKILDAANILDQYEWRPKYYFERDVITRKLEAMLRKEKDFLEEFESQ